MKRKHTTFTLILATLLFGACSSGKDAKSMVENGATLLDVRTPGEFAAGHVPGAINIPVHLLSTRLEELGDKTKPIVVYCQSGKRSGRAKTLLLENGFAKVHNMGPMSAWPK